MSADMLDGAGVKEACHCHQLEQMFGDVSHLQTNDKLGKRYCLILVSNMLHIMPIVVT